MKSVFKIYKFLLNVVCRSASVDTFFGATCKQYYEFNAVDHCTTWRLIRAFRNINHYNIKIFLKELEESCPFPIFEMQTDNGVEFTDKYRGGNLEPSGQHPVDQWCARHTIVHRLIPIGQKELNGKVENTHKQDDREFYAGVPDTSFEKLESRMKSYNYRWNNLRFTKSLGWRTPEQCIAARKFCGSLFQLPPRITRLEPKNGHYANVRDSTKISLLIASEFT
jgi:hypothetical protein